VVAVIRRVIKLRLDVAGRGLLDRGEAQVEWLFERLEQEEAAERERLESLQAQVESLRAQVKGAEERLARLTITRETALALQPTNQTRLGDGGGRGDDQAPDPPKTNGNSPAPTATAEKRRPLSGTNQQVVVLLAEAGRPMRAKEISLAVGDSDQHGRVEGMRTRLKRLVSGGWLAEQNPGQFSIASGVNGHAVEGAADTGN
jgi:hypothetical protein